MSVSDFFDPIITMSFSDTPLEVIEEIIDSLRDDSAALNACSQTCQSLLPLCRKYIFQTVVLQPRSQEAKLRGLPRYVTLFGNLLDSNSQIADYVQNLIYRMETPDFEDESVPRILDKLRRIQYFQLSSGMKPCIDWSALRPNLRESLSHIIHSATYLNISCIEAFPINIFAPCINLIHLSLAIIEADMDGYEHEYFVQDAVPQLQSLTAGVLSGEYTASLVDARRSNDVPVLDFSNLRSLDINIDDYSSLDACAALLEEAEKLENLHCYGMYQSTFIYLPQPTLITLLVDFIKWRIDIPALMNPSSFSTLKILRFALVVKDDIQDPLCGVCVDLTAFSGQNIIEKIVLVVLVGIDCQCRTDNEWRKLDDVLATGFPRLSQVTLCIDICVSSSDGIALQDKLNKLPEEQFPWLSKSSTVKFDFSVKIYTVSP